MRLTTTWFTGFLMTMIIAAGSCYAGAWTASKGNMYHKMTFNEYEADEAFSRSGGKQNFPGNGIFSETNVNYYLEYGITDDLTILGSVSYKWLESETTIMTSRANGFSDVDLGLKYRLLSGDFGIISVQGLVKIPELYDDDEDVALGNNQYDTELRLLYGRSLYPYIPGYFNIEAGYRFRAEEPADEFRYLVELGVDITDVIYGRIKLDGIAGMGNDDPGVSPTGNPTASLDYDVGKLDLAFGFRLSERWGLELGYRMDIYGEYTAAGDNISLALVMSH